MEVATWQRRHPHQVLIAGMCVVTGLPVLFGGPRPGSLVATLPPLLVYTWAATFVLGGAMIVAAALVRSVMHALYLELVADLPVGLTAITYSAALVSITGTRGVASALLFGGAAAAFFVRFYQTVRATSRVREALRRTGNDA